MTSMNEIPDNELDDLFRKSAEEMDIPFDAEAWQRMEKKLDGASRTDKNPWMRWGWLGLLLLLLSTGTYVWVRNSSGTEAKGEKQVAVVTQTDQDVAKNEKVNETVAEEKTNENGKRVASPNKTKPTQADRELTTYGSGKTNTTKHQNTDTDKKELQVLSLEKTKTKQSSIIKSEEEQQPAMVAPIRTAEISRKKQASLSDVNSPAPADKKLRRFSHAPVTEPVSSGNRHSDNAPKSLTKTEKTRSVRKQKQVSAMPEKLQPSGNEIVSSGNEKPAKQNEKLLMALPAEDIQLEANARSRRLLVDNYHTQEGQRLYVNALMAKPIAKQPVVVQSLEIHPEVKMLSKPPIDPLPKNQLPAMSRLGVRFIVAPDMSSVGFQNFVQPGTNFGLMFEYRLTNRLMVSTGGLYTQKVYTAKGSDYHTPGGNKPGYDIVKVNAGCNIIDIPLNLRYDVIQKERSNWFVTVGASSYLMKKENYEYHYYYYGKYGVKDWSIKNSNNHFFAVGNLSLGYEHAMSRRLSWQVEPYLKLPLGGVGFGKIRLMSSGLFFSVKYHPFVRK